MTKSDNIQEHNNEYIWVNTEVTRPSGKMHSVVLDEKKVIYFVSDGGRCRSFNNSS